MKASAVWMVEFSCATVTKFLKEAVGDLTWIQSTIATRRGVCRYVQCTTINKLEKVFKSPRDLKL